MASKAEIALRVLNVSLSTIVPAVRDLIERRRQLKAIVKAGKEIDDADWAAADADLEAVVEGLRQDLLGSESEPEPKESSPDEEPPQAA